MADNIGSWRVLEKCGLRRVRTFYYPDADLMPGAEHGDVVYELTRSDWTRLVNPAETEDRRPGHTS
jgi:RimJ/RimL family protein N-acetyltransferase